MDGATPFFGAKISLISKSEIRYEGVLYTIDPKESTIALAKVRSFGTENRQADHIVPPRDEIFEFIIFRASDIKDLVVDDAPPTQATPPAPQPVFDDPAIVSSKSIPPAPGSAAPAAAPSSSQGPAGASSAAGASKPNENGQAEKKSQSSVPKSAWGGVSALNLQQNGQQSQENNRNIQNLDHQQQRQPREYQQNRQRQYMTNYQSGQRGGMGGMGGGYRPQQGPGGYRHQNNYGGGMQGQRFNNTNNNRIGGQGNYRGRGGMNRGPRNHHFQPRNNGPFKFAPLPDGEFDFEKAHSDFQMLEEKLKSLKLNNGQAEGAEGAGSSSGELPPIEGIPASAITVSALEEEADIPSEPCYNKSTSFFDNISCEAVEREKGTVKRVDWKAERSLNKETFGVSSARPTHQRFFNNNRRNGFGFTHRA